MDDAIRDLAAHFRRYDEPHLASAVESAVNGDPVHLPRRVLALFTHGMGGLMDRTLYSGGVVNQQATMHRDELAQRLYDEA